MILVQPWWAVTACSRWQHMDHTLHECCHKGSFPDEKLFISLSTKCVSTMCIGLFACELCTWGISVPWCKWSVLGTNLHTVPFRSDSQMYKWTLVQSFAWKCISVPHRKRWYLPEYSIMSEQSLCVPWLHCCNPLPRLLLVLLARLWLVVIQAVVSSESTEEVLVGSSQDKPSSPWGCKGKGDNQVGDLDAWLNGPAGGWKAPEGWGIARSPGCSPAFENVQIAKAQWVSNPTLPYIVPSMQHFLNVMIFCVKVPVLSEKTYWICPRWSFRLVLLAFAGVSLGE